MHKKFLNLEPIKLKFDLYSTDNFVIKDAPAFWSRHRHYVENSYAYSVIKRRYDEIELDLESVCPKEKIVFENVKINLEEYIQKLKEAYEATLDYITFEVKVSYNNLDESYCCQKCIMQTSSCKNISKCKPEFGTVKIFFDFEKIKEAVERYNQLNTDTCKVEPASLTSVQIETINSKNKEEKRMDNNFMNPAGTNQQGNFTNAFANMGGFDFKFGPVNDPRIASTAFGVVFQGEGGRWYSFDEEKGVRTDVTGFQFGNFPMMLFPAKRDNISKGDLILYNDEYYYVKSKKAATFTLISAATGVETTVYPATNILNMEIFTKVFVLMDGASLTGFGGEDLEDNFAMAMMLGMFQGTSGTASNGMENWMPLLLMLKDGDTPFAGLFDQVSGDGEGSMLQGMLPFMCMANMGGGTGQNNMMANPLTYLLMTKLFSGLSKKKTSKKGSKASNKKDSDAFEDKE